MEVTDEGAKNIPQVPQTMDLPQMTSTRSDPTNAAQFPIVSTNVEDVLITREITGEFTEEEIQIAQFLDALTAQKLRQDQGRPMDLDQQYSSIIPSTTDRNIRSKSESRNDNDFASSSKVPPKYTNTLTEEELEIARFLGRISQSFQLPPMKSDNQDPGNIFPALEQNVSTNYELQDEALNVIDDLITPEFLGTFREQEIEVAKLLMELASRKFQQKQYPS